MKRLLSLLFIVGLGWGAYTVISGGNFNSIFDRTPPQIALPTTALGAGMDAVKVPITLHDEGAGVGTVLVSVIQNGERREVLSRTFSTPREEEILEIDFSPRALGMKEGAAEIVVEAADSSWWGKNAQASAALTVDYARPKVEVLTLQHIASVGGAEFVMYKASDSNMTGSGVRVGAAEFPGAPIAQIDPSFEHGEGIYGALFALPLEMAPGDKVEAYARDGSGNVTLAPVSFRIEPDRPTVVNSKLTKTFLEAKMPELVDKFLVASGKNIKPDNGSTEGLMASFKLVNEDYRRLLNEKLRVIFEAPLTPRRWTNEVFLKPMPSATSSVFGEHRSYALDGVPVSQSMHNGVDLASTGNAVVRAVQNGTVVMAEDHGIYGNLIVIDHGLGVFSLYGHLASMLVNVGDSVERGGEIARTGMTGLAGGDHLHFEFRVRNVPVTPIEWWDPKWLNDNIEGKIAAVKETLSPANPA